MEILERVHSNVCGPFSTTSTTKHMYYVIFVDDFYRKCWIYFMQKKDQSFSKFCELKALVEKDTRKQVKALRATMVLSTSPMNSITSVPKKEFRES